MFREYTCGFFLSYGDHSHEPKRGEKRREKEIQMEVKRGGGRKDGVRSGAEKTRWDKSEKRRRRRL